MSGPRIGLNCDVATPGGKDRVTVPWVYLDAVQRAGGLPMLLPPVDAEGAVAAYLADIDGLVLIGGADYDPQLYGQSAHAKTKLVAERRQRFDVRLAKAAAAAGVPTLGICGGIQLLNVALGGTLIQHIADAVPEALTHTRSGEAEGFHEVTVAGGSRLAGVVGAGPLEVNSSHHQAIGEPAPGLTVTARAPDGVVEAVEGTGEAFLLGVQWHPERLADRPEHLALFQALVAAAERRR